MIGDVIFAQFPMADKPVFKERPCLIISNADEWGDFEVLKISSKAFDTSGMIKIKPGSFQKGSLPMESWIIVNDVAKTNAASVTRYCGQLNME